MIVKSIKSELLKEASTRVGIKSDLGRVEDDLKSYLFREASASVQKRSAMRKRAMALFTAQGQFANSNVVVTKLKSEEGNEYDHLYDVFKPYFYRLGTGNKQQAILPTELVRTYAITREFMAQGDTESAKKTNNNISTAIKIIDEIIPGFNQFVEDLKSSPMPLVQFFQKNHRNRDYGGYNSNELGEFISTEVRRFQTNPLKFNNEPIGDTYYQQHAQEDKVHAPGQTRVSKIYPLSDIDSENKPGKLRRWIKYAYDKRYKLDINAVYAEIQKLQEEELTKNKLDNVKVLDAKGIESRNSIIAYMTGQIPGSDKVYSNSQWGRIIKAVKKNCFTGKAESCDMPLRDLRIFAKHLKPQIADPEVPAGHWYVPDETWSYYPNGFDSRPDDAEQTMLLVPNMKRLPSGHLVYDRDQGNFGGNHARTYGADLEQLIRKWGKWATKSLYMLDRKAAKDSIREKSKSLPNDGSVDRSVAIAAVRNILNNMSNADIMLDTLSKFPDYKSYYDNVLNKSMASTFENLNLYSGRAKQKNKPKFTKTGRFQIAQPPMRGSMPERAMLHAQNLNAALKQQLAPMSNEDQIQKSAIVTSIKNDVEEMAAILTEEYLKAAQGGAKEALWNEYSLAMSQLGMVAVEGKPVVDNLASTKGTHIDSMLTEDGFAMMKQFGYPIAKLMDLADAVRVRSTNDFTNNRIAWSKDDMGRKIPQYIAEKSFGRQMGTGHGKAGATRLMIGIRYAFNAKELGSYNPELKKRVRYFRGKQKVKVPPGGMDPTRVTQHPQRGTPVDPRLADEVDGVVIENITWWIGQASGDMYRPLGENEDDRKVENKSWGEVVDYISQHYPQLQESTGDALDLINIDLRHLQDSSKRALKRVCEELDAGAVFVTSDGEETVIGEEDMPESDVGLDVEAQTSADRAGVATIEVPPTVETEPEVEIEPEPEPEVEESLEPQIPTETTTEAPVSVTRDDIENLIMELDAAAEADENETMRDLIQNIDIAVRNGSMTPESAYQQLQNIERKLLGDPETEMDFADQGLMEYWEEKIGSGNMTMTDVIKLDHTLDRIKRYVARKGIQLPPNLQSYISESTQIQEQQPQQYDSFEGENEAYDPDFDADNYMPMKSMPAKSMPTKSHDYISKRTKGRSLVVNRPDPNTGKLQRADVINTMVKMADRLDDAGEYVLADKITMLLNKVSEE